MGRRESDDARDAFDTMPDRPSGWRGFAADASAWEILRAFDRLGSSRNEADKVARNAPVVVASLASFLLVGWGLVALGSLSMPRAGYGLAALLCGVGLYRIARAFTRGARWALPFVAAVPPAIAASLYWWLRPPLQVTGAGDVAVWLLIAAFALADLSFLFGPVHPSWEPEPWE